MTKAQIWLEHWFCNGEWQLCVSLTGEELDVNCYPIHSMDALNMIKRGVESRGDIYDPGEYGVFP